LARFEAEGEPFLSRIVIADGSIIFNGIQKGNPWKITVFNLLGGKKVCISGQGHDHWAYEETVLMDAMPKTETVNSEVYFRALIELGSVSNDFGLTGLQKKSCFRKAALKF
jgi:predicted phosphohydrolase